MTIPVITTPATRQDGARIVADLGASPDLAQSPAPVPLAKPIQKVADSRTTLPGRAA